MREAGISGETNITRNEWQSDTKVRPKSTKERSTLPLRGGKMLLQIMESQNDVPVTINSVLQTER